VFAAREGGEAGIAFVLERRAAVERAKAAAERVKRWDVEKVLAGDDAGAVGVLLGRRRGDAWVPGVLDEYGDAVMALDNVSAPAELAGWAQPNLRAQRQRLVDDRPTLTGNRIEAGKATRHDIEHRGELAQSLDNAMTPARRAEYEKIYGKKFQDLDEVYGPAPSKIEGEGGINTPRFRDDAAAADAGTAAGSAGRRKGAAREADSLYDDLTVAEPIRDNHSLLSRGDDAVAKPGARIGEAGGAPMAQPFYRPSSLEAFAYDVQAVAGQIGRGGLDDVLRAMASKGGKPPFKPDRFKELVAEAEQAGYLATAGNRAEMPYLGQSVGDEIVITKDFAAGDAPRFSKRERFRFADRGRKAGDTLVDTAPRGQVDDGSVINESTGSVRRDALEDALENGVTTPRGDSSAAPAQPASGWDAGDTQVNWSPRAVRESKLTPGDLDNAGMYLSNKGPVRSYGDEAAAQLNRAIDEIQELTAGRVGSQEALEAAVAAGLAPGPRGRVSEALAGVWGLRQLGKAAAEASKGVSAARGSLMEKIMKRSGVAAGRAVVLGDKVSRAVMGSAGGALGGHLVGLAFGAAGGLASSVGRTRDAVIKAGAALL
jgi:hypothetical protein